VLLQENGRDRIQTNVPATANWVQSPRTCGCVFGLRLDILVGLIPAHQIFAGLFRLCLATERRDHGLFSSTLRYMTMVQWTS
jgi:hypothetical protein